MDPLVKIVSVKDSPGFDIGTLRARNQKIVTFMAGDHGPFTLTYDAADYSMERVQQDIQKEVDTLRGIGALPATAAY
jgi:hypothetical protein